MIQPLRSRAPERGAIGVAFSVIVLIGLAFIGLVFDGGSRLQAMQRADNAAAEAARAAGQHISGADLTGETGIDRAAAVAAARNYLAAADVDGDVSIHGDIIRVTTATSEPTVFLSILGITTMSATGEASVRITTGL
ncbi:hypothetical protein G1H11_16250 [Phytoactinopolyspora alkaliphila]|uniref:Putative Flp pilus-assembly TadG-like N-terminal domain-containing protein n=1 Tax=Phytoactinopolyspora alkaliphila TaxID=1783498 RepID=A0A6N9YPV6_9ACTN|nr:pilus assembly protein TadG-related protein [Phytoactinopolyspora alkaliphila]NED96859.1 hypothetical protein [Phytoactinopolyspora alkaliphila]